MPLTNVMKNLLHFSFGVLSLEHFVRKTVCQDTSSQQKLNEKTNKSKSEIKLQF